MLYTKLKAFLFLSGEVDFQMVFNIYGHVNDFSQQTATFSIKMYPIHLQIFRGILAEIGPGASEEK